MQFQLLLLVKPPFVEPVAEVMADMLGFKVTNREPVNFKAKGMVLTKDKYPCMYRLNILFLFLASTIML